MELPFTEMGRQQEEQVRRQNQQSGFGCIRRMRPCMALVGMLLQHQSIRCMNQWGGWGLGRLGCLSCLDEQPAVHIGGLKRTGNDGGVVTRKSHHGPGAKNLEVWVWSSKKRDSLRLFKGWLCGLGDEDKYFPLKTLDDFTTAVTILEIMINGPCLSFTAEIFFTSDEGTLFISSRRNEFNFFGLSRKNPKLLWYFIIQCQCLLNSSAEKAPTPPAFPRNILSWTVKICKQTRSGHHVELE